MYSRTWPSAQGCPLLALSVLALQVCMSVSITFAIACCIHAETLLASEIWLLLLLLL